ncbi:MAG: hypothetical protein WAS54_06090 [Scrofimicrobium sp.]
MKHHSPTEAKPRFPVLPQTAVDGLWRGPALPEGVTPTNQYCGVFGKRMIFAPPIRTLSPEIQAASWDWWLTGRTDGYDEGVLSGYQMGYAQAESDMAAIQRQAVAVVQSLPNKSLADRYEESGELDRANQLRERAERLGYAI